MLRMVLPYPFQAPPAILKIIDSEVMISKGFTPRNGIAKVKTTAATIGTTAPPTTVQVHHRGLVLHSSADGSFSAMNDFVKNYKTKVLLGVRN